MFCTFELKLHHPLKHRQWQTLSLGIAGSQCCVPHGQPQNTLPVKGLGTPSYSMFFLYMYYFSTVLINTGDQNYEMTHGIM